MIVAVFVVLALIGIIAATAYEAVSDLIGMLIVLAFCWWLISMAIKLFN